MKTTEQLARESGAELAKHLDGYWLMLFSEKELEAFRRECECNVLEEFATKWLPSIKRCDNQTSQSQTWQNQGIDDAIKHVFAMIKERTK